jgi:glycosyltransferase involved in cell wall biosynthesis
VPKVSILIPSYNHERYIRECVDSALDQTHRDREVIVIDDGSKDSSQDILRSYGDQIRFSVNDHNVGTYPTLNRALAMGTGDYVAILNSDDKWRPTKLENQVALMEASPNMSFCHTHGRFIDENGCRIEGAPMGFHFPITPNGRIHHLFVEKNMAVASSVVIRASTAREVGGFDESFRNFGDWEMWLRLSEIGEVGFVSEPVTEYRVHGANTIYAAEITRLEEMRIRTQHRERANDLLRNYHDANAMRVALAHSLACLASLHSVEDEPKRARELFAASLKLNPMRIKSALRFLLTFAPLSVRRRLL